MKIRSEIVTRRDGFRVWRFSSGEERIYQVGISQAEGSWMFSLTESTYRLLGLSTTIG